MSPLEKLRIPFALDESGKFVTAQEVQRGACVRCAACKAALIVRKGKVRSHHFAHASAGTCPLEGDGFAHEAAIIAIVASCERALAGGKFQPIISYDCRSRAPGSSLACGQSVELSIASIPFSKVEREYAVRAKRVDVALLTEDGRVALAIEVCDSHEVNREKQDALAGIPLLELDAMKIISSHLDWTAKHHQDVDAFGACPCSRPRPYDERRRRAETLRGRAQAQGARNIRPLYALWNEPDAARAFRVVVPTCPETRTSDVGVPCYGCKYKRERYQRLESHPSPGEPWAYVACDHPGKPSVAQPPRWYYPRRKESA
jgi:hypothetical protein